MSSRRPRGERPAAGTDPVGRTGPEAVTGLVPPRWPALGTARGLLRACRPRQWLKNGLVFAAPAAAGMLTAPAALAWAGFAFAVFCVAASGTYLLNDARDAETDRRHAAKSRRPVAAGIVSVRMAVMWGVALVAAAVLLVVAAGNTALAATLTGYLVLTTAYTLWLKHVAVCDIAAVSGCHVLRAVAGAVAVGVPATSWFLIVVSLGALLVVVGKREAELANPDSGGSRAILNLYTATYLAQLRTMASGAIIVTYCLWALEHNEGSALSLYAASIVPFVMVVLRLNLLMAQGGGEEPEEIPFKDRPTQIFLSAFLLLLALAIYAV